MPAAVEWATIHGEGKKARRDASSTAAQRGQLVHGYVSVLTPFRNNQDEKQRSAEGVGHKRIPYKTTAQGRDEVRMTGKKKMQAGHLPSGRYARKHTGKSLVFQ